MDTITNPELFGWDLIYQMNLEAINNKYDIILCFIHWILIKNLFRCCGLDDLMDTSLDCALSEALPEGWSICDTVRIYYVYNNEVFVLTSVKQYGILILNFQRSNDNIRTTLKLNTNVVLNIRGTLSELIPNYLHVKQQIEQKLIGYFIDKQSKDATTQTSIFETDEYSPELEQILRILNNLPLEEPLSRDEFNTLILKFEDILRENKTGFPNASNQDSVGHSSETEPNSVAPNSSDFESTYEIIPEGYNTEFIPTIILQEIDNISHENGENQGIIRTFEITEIFQIVSTEETNDDNIEPIDENVIGDDILNEIILGIEDLHIDESSPLDDSGVEVQNENDLNIAEEPVLINLQDDYPEYIQFDNIELLRHYEIGQEIHLEILDVSSNEDASNRNSNHDNGSSGN